MENNFSENKQGTLKELINSLMLEMEKKDPAMKAHATRVANQCVLFTKELDRPSKEINQIYIAGLLHDIGMVFIPDNISSRKNGLTESEMEYIKKHTILSEKILSKYDVLKEILPMIRHHHEAIDGSGYPDGLKGDDIPAGAKILYIVNIYDRLITSGNNAKPSGIDQALDEMVKLSGNKLDRALTERFISFIRADENKQEKIEKNSNPEPVRQEPEKPLDNEEILKGSIKEIVTGIIHKFRNNDLNLPVLPEVVKNIQDVINSPSSGMDNLAEVIEKDAVISVRLIHVANSVLYRGAEKILTVKQAIPRIGAKETQSIVATIANKSLYEVKDRVFKKLMERLWKHSLASAFAARSIAGEMRLGDTEKYYFMGLVHDIGKVLILKTLGDAHYKDQTLSIDDMITEVRAAHTGFGSSILRKWGFGEDYCRVCLLHSGPKFKPSTDKEILVTNLAGNIAKKGGFGVTSNPDSINLSTLFSRILLAIEPPQIDSIIEDTVRRMSETSDIFH
ncbi:MAG: HDOD domain-containing protein [Deltaproteobacteria bacterium]|nr:HDOD domain-containing protein [Deltaproteobacteria bacterium]